MISKTTLRNRFYEYDNREAAILQRWAVVMAFVKESTHGPSGEHNRARSRE